MQRRKLLSALLGGLFLLSVLASVLCTKEKVVANPPTEDKEKVAAKCPTEEAVSDELAKLRNRINILEGRVDSAQRNSNILEGRVDSAQRNSPVVGWIQVEQAEITKGLHSGNALLSTVAYPNKFHFDEAPTVLIVIQGMVSTFPAGTWWHAIAKNVTPTGFDLEMGVSGSPHTGIRFMWVAIPKRVK